MSPDKFLEVAFFVICVALIMLVVQDDVNASSRGGEPAQFFVFFVDACNAFFEMAINRVGLKELMIQW